VVQVFVFAIIRPVKAPDYLAQVIYPVDIAHVCVHGWQFSEGAVFVEKIGAFQQFIYVSAHYLPGIVDVNQKGRVELPGVRVVYVREPV